MPTARFLPRALYFYTAAVPAAAAAAAAAALDRERRTFRTVPETEKSCSVMGRAVTVRREN